MLPTNNIGDKIDKYNYTKKYNENTSPGIRIGIGPDIVTHATHAVTHATIDISPEQQLFQEMKALFGGCNSTIDAIQISDHLFFKYPDYVHRQLITSFRDSLIYIDNIDTMTKITSLESVKDADTKDDAQNLKNKLVSRSSDHIYKNSLERIVSRKRNRSSNSKSYARISQEKFFIVKSCPHCRENMRMTEDTSYVICGYPDTYTGYDWKGCCNDWCFACEKLLCKSWEKDLLNIESNRKHNDECCKSHSNKNGFKYPMDYCQCLTNTHVSRKEHIWDYVKNLNIPQ
jgi:hypothetical protein